MISFGPLLAQQSIPIEVVSAPWNKIDAATKEILIILGSVALVTLLAVMWAVASRKRRQRRTRHHSHHHHSHSQSHERSETAEAPIEEESHDEPEPGTERRRRRRRHRRRDHRPRNPTLAETGGLPPLRTGRPPDPYP